jgi:TRAP-type C4-dicarboxylate transport system permease large subunit
MPGRGSFRDQRRRRLCSAIVGGASGSAVADASAMGDGLIPVQKKKAPPAGFAAAINASSSAASVLIPPPIPLILYGLVSNTSVTGSSSPASCAQPR